MNCDRTQGLRVVAIVVAYNSELSELHSNLAGYSGSDVIICDNSTDSDRAASIENFAAIRGMRYLSMDGNRGIAYAQNRGIENSEQLGADFVLLLDDDSRLEPASIPALIEAYQKLNCNGRKMAAVCARPISANEAPANELLESTPCSNMMSSGSLISISTIRSVGLMDEALFIDYVDFEWGWRAQAAGFKIYSVASVTFRHALGEGTRTVWGLKLKVKAPIRHYYQTRNTIRLLTRPYVPLSWKLRQMLATAVKCLAFPLLLPPRSERLSYCFKGLVSSFYEGSLRHRRL